jgi:pimeloyl-ACP methyl ester carboxylesterase
MAEPESRAARLRQPDGSRVAYCHLAGAAPGVLFCPGFKSDMAGTKALALEAFCRARGRQYTRFDYFGHGQSSGDFEAGTIGRWRDDAITVLDAVTRGPQILVGSSMGAWIMVLTALARPHRVHALLGIASAPDFTEYKRGGGFSQEQMHQLDTLGYCDVPNSYDDGQPYRIRRELLDEGRNHLVLDGEIPLDLPVRLIHALDDPDVPWQRSMELLGRLRSRDVELQLLKRGGHRLSEPADLERVLATLDRLLETAEA